MKLTSLVKQKQKQSIEECEWVRKLNIIEKSLIESGDLDFLSYCYKRWQIKKVYETQESYEKVLMERFKQIKPTKITVEPLCIWFKIDGYEAGFKVINCGTKIQGFVIIQN